MTQKLGNSSRTKEPRWREDGAEYAPRGPVKGNACWDTLSSKKSFKPSKIFEFSQGRDGEDREKTGIEDTTGKTYRGITRRGRANSLYFPSL